MSIKRFEGVTVNNVARGRDANGEATDTLTPFFKTAAQVSDVSNELKLKDMYREYSDLVWLKINYTINSRLMADNFNNYSINWRGNDWRITDARETNDRMFINFLCFRVAPGVKY